MVALCYIETEDKPRLDGQLKLSCMLMLPLPYYKLH